MGVIGLQLHAHANGIDRSEIDKKYKVLEKSISNSQILMKDYTDKKEVMIIIREMVDLVGSRLRKNMLKPNQSPFLSATLTVSCYQGFRVK